MIQTQPYVTRNAIWPSCGRHIPATFDESTVVVYQAYRQEIADFAIKHGRFGGPFSSTRMSWILK